MKEQSFPSIPDEAPAFPQARSRLRPLHNVHLAIVKQALGHRNIASTAIYAVPTDEQTGRAVNAALAGLF